MDILLKIKKMQKETGWNDAKLSKESGLPASTISAMFKRYNQPTVYTLEAICKAFGVTLSQFFADSNLPLDLTAEQSCLLENWNRLNTERKAAVLALLKSLNL